MTMTVDHPVQELKAGTIQFFLTPAQLRSLASLAIVTAKDDTSSIIEQVQVNFDADTRTITAYGTDRYRVAELVLTLDQGTDQGTRSGQILVPATLLTKAVKSMGRPSKDFEVVPYIRLCSFDEDSGRRWVQLDDRVSGDWKVRDMHMVGRFPTVSRFFPTEVTDVTDVKALTRINARLLADLAKLRLPGDFGREQAWDIAQIRGDSSDPLLHPLYFLRTDDGGNRLRYIQQPVRKP